MRSYIVAAVIFVTATTGFGQSADPPETLKSVPGLSRPVLGSYYSQVDGLSLVEVAKRAFETHGDLVVARLEVDKARARLRQAELRANPSVEIEQSNGTLVGMRGDRETSIGVSLPLEVFGQRSRRIEVARAEVTLREAELASRQREIATQLFAAYADALSALREMKVIEELLSLDEQTVRFVQIRVNEGDTPPLELSMLQTEIDRLRARRELNEGRVQAALARLRLFAGIPHDQPLKLRDEITTAQLPPLPASAESGIQLGLKNRPEIRLGLLEEELANAGLRLVRAQSKPEVSASARYAQGRSILDDPRGAFVQNDRSLTFGLTIGLPIFNRNQGAKAEAGITIRQARERRLFAERVIQNEITAAFRRFEAARRAATLLETSVIPRSLANIETVRKVYEIGELKITDLIAEQRKLLEANRELTETLTERYRAQADLFLSVGLTLEN